MEPGQIHPDDTKVGGYYHIHFKNGNKREPYIWLYKQSEKGIKYGDGVCIPHNPVNGYTNKNVSFADHINIPDRCVITTMTPELIQYFEHCIATKYITFQEFEKLKPKELPIFN